MCDSSSIDSTVRGHPHYPEPTPILGRHPEEKILSKSVNWTRLTFGAALLTGGMAMATGWFSTMPEGATLVQRVALSLGCITVVIIAL
jgi:hypothetical protein